MLKLLVAFIIVVAVLVIDLWIVVESQIEKLDKVAKDFNREVKLLNDNLGFMKSLQESNKETKEDIK